MLFSNNLASEYNHQIQSLDYAENSAIEYGEFSVKWTKNDSTQWIYYARSATHWLKTIRENGK